MFVLSLFFSNAAFGKGGSSEASVIGIIFFLIFIIIWFITSDEAPTQSRWKKWFFLIISLPIILVVKIFSIYDYMKDKYQRKGK